MILPKAALDLSRLGGLNIHPSLLPKYRGPSPIQSAILNGDAEIGVTIFKMDEQIDHGPIIANGQWPIANSKIATPELSRKLSNLGAELLLKILPAWLAGQIALTPQDDNQATFTKIITKKDGQINWQKSAIEIERQILAYTPWPGSFSKWPIANDGWQTIKIIDADVKYDVLPPYAKGGWGVNKQPGEAFLTDANDLAVKTGHGTLIIKKLQLEGGKPLSAQDFLRGHQDILGKILK